MGRMVVAAAPMLALLALAVWLPDRVSATVAVLAASGGYIVGFVSHYISGKTPDPVIVTLPNGASLKEAGTLLRNVANEMKQRGWDSRRDLLSGLVLKDQGAVYTPEVWGDKAPGRFLRAAELSDELEAAIRKRYGDQHPDDRGHSNAEASS